MFNMFKRGAWLIAWITVIAGFPLIALMMTLDSGNGSEWWGNVKDFYKDIYYNLTSI